MQLGVFVDGTVNANEETVRLEIGQMLLEIEPRAIPQPGAMQSGGLIEHLGCPVPPGLGRVQPITIRSPPATRSAPPDALRSRPLRRLPTLNQQQAPWSPRRCKRSTFTLIS